MTDLMTTAEVAAYLRLKERKIYELTRQRRIPCTRVAGKWLFPRRVIDGWIGRHTEYQGTSLALAPPGRGTGAGRRHPSDRRRHRRLQRPRRHGARRHGRGGAAGMGVARAR